MVRDPQVTQFLPSCYEIPGSLPTNQEHLATRLLNEVEFFHPAQFACGFTKIGSFFFWGYSSFWLVT